MNNEKLREEDEIDLAEIVCVLFKRWRCIVYITIIAFLIGSFYSFFIYYQKSASDKYMFKSTFRIGQFVNAQGKHVFIEQPKSVEQYIIEYASILGIKSKKYFDNNELSFSIQGNLNVNANKDSGIVHIYLEASKDSYAESFLERLVENILKRHNEFNKSYVEQYKNNYLNKNISSDNYLITLYNTEIMLKPTVSDSPVSSQSINYKLYIAISLILGVFLGLFTAFLREFWVNNRNKILGKEND